MNLTFTSKVLDKLTPKDNAYIAYHASGERGTGRLGLRVYPTGKKAFVYRYFVGTAAKFQTLGSYPEMALSTAFAKFEALSVSKDVIKTSGKQQLGTLGELFDAHEADYKAAGKRAYHHFISLRASIANSGLLPQSTIANRITSSDCRAFLSHVYKATGKRTWVNEVRSRLSALIGFGMRCDKSIENDTVNLKFDIPFNPVTPIPVLECEAYVGNRFLDFDELGQLMKDARSGKHFCADLSVFIELAFFCCGQRPYELMGAEKQYYDREAKMLSIPPEIAKTKEWYHLALCDSAIALIDEMCARYPDSPYIFPDVRYEQKKARYLEKAKNETLKPSSHMPTPFMSSDTLSESICRYHKHTGMKSFTPRDFRRTFKTLGGQIKLSKEIRDRIQNHCKNDISSKHYDRYDYFEEKMEAVMIWECKLLELLS